VCDVCKSSYAPVVFLRCEDGQVSVPLLQAKSRIAPLKKITIPRLEPLACCFCACLLAFVKKGMDLGDAKEHFCTNTSTALHWIRKEEH
jgi:hypothetical protein